MSSTNRLKYFSFLELSEIGQKCILVSTPSTRHSHPTVMKLYFSPEFEKHLNIKFHENAFSRARVFLSGQAGGRTDRHDEAVAFRNLANAPKNPSPLYLRCHIGCSVPSNGTAVLRFPVQTDSILVHRMSVTVY